MLKALIDLLNRLARWVLDLFRGRAARRADWAIEEIASLSETDERALLDGGAGLTNDRMAVWTERRDVQQSNGGPAKVRTIRRAVPAVGVAGFTVTDLPMHQLDGRAVHLRVGGVNHGRRIAATATSQDGRSVWAVLPSGTWLNPQAGGTRHSAADIDEAGRIVGAGVLAGAVDQEVACIWNDAQAAPRALFALTLGNASAATAISPNTGAVAGVMDQVGDVRLRLPWYQTENGLQHLAYVPGLDGGGAASDINDALTSCGSGWRDAGAPASDTRAWRWSPEDGTDWLPGVIDAGVEQAATAQAINARGEVVGRSAGRAVFWSKPVGGGRTRAVDLAAAVGQTGLELTAAVAINDHTEILCFGARTTGGVRSQKVFLVRFTGLRVVGP